VSAGALAAAEEAARRELAAVPEWLWDGAPPVPLEVIADSHYGLLVEGAPALGRLVGLPDEVHVSGILLPARRTIMVNADEAGWAPGRRRFTIAHEIGHWVLHCGAGPVASAPAFCREAAVGPDAPTGAAPIPAIELEANRFAAAMLMPREELLRRPRPVGVDAEYALAHVFGVSRQALLRRLADLGAA
jgi:hypothetical protein